MSGHQHSALGDTVYFWFAANNTSGSGNDGATALFDVREAGESASAAPLLSGSPSLLTHASYPAGCYEVAVAATVGNGFAADDVFSVFCTLAVDSQNPSGFIGSCTLTPLSTVVATDIVSNGAITTDSGSVSVVDLVSALTTYTGNTPQTGDAYARLATYRLGELMSAALASQPFTGSLLGDLTQDNPDVSGTQQFTVAALMRLMDEVLTSGNHNITNSLGRRIRTLQDNGIYNGKVWYDGINGSSGTVDHENGTDLAQSNSIADTNTLLASLGLSIVEVAPGSSIAFSVSQTNQLFKGANWELNLGSQSISGSSICGADVTGSCTGAAPPRFECCSFGAVTVPPCRINGKSGFEGTLTLGSAGNLDIINCFSLVAGESAPTFDLGIGTGASNVNIKGWDGGVNVVNVEAGDVVSIQGEGGIITIDGTGGAVKIRGIFEIVVDDSGGAVEIDQSAMLNRRAIGVYADGIHVDTNSSNTSSIPYTDGTADNPCGSLSDAYDLAADPALANAIVTFNIASGSDIVLPSVSTFRTFIGDNYTVDLNTQNIEGSSFTRAAQITGIGTGGTEPPTFFTCGFGSVTLPPSNGQGIGFFGTFTTTAASGSYIFGEGAQVSSNIPIIDCDGGAPIFKLLDWRGDRIELQNSSLGARFAMSGIGGLTINANCAALTEVTLGGSIDLTNNATGITLVNEVNYSETQSSALLLAQLGTPSDTDVSTDILNVKTVVDDLSTRTPAALVGGRMDGNVGAISGSATSADNLQGSTEAMFIGICEGTPTTTVIQTDLALTDNDMVIGALFIIGDGIAAGQRRTILDYNGSTGEITVSALPGGIAPEAGDAWVIV